MIPQARVLRVGFLRRGLNLFLQGFWLPFFVLAVLFALGFSHNYFVSCVDKKDKAAREEAIERAKAVLTMSNPKFTERAVCESDAKGCDGADSSSTTCYFKDEGGAIWSINCGTVGQGCSWHRGL